MIKVVRKAKPQSLVDHETAWTRDYLAARVAEDADPTPDNKKHRKLCEAKYAQDDVKKALKTMFHLKCAFCERKRDYPHIEHFYPKAEYPGKCFEWGNLLLACEVCNGPEFKGTKFPLDADNTPLLINPCEDNPNDHLEFVFEKDTSHPDGFIAIIRGKTKKGETTTKILGLNRPNLIGERNGLLFPYYLKLAEEAGNGDITSKQLLKQACESKSIFAAFARSLWEQFIGAYQ